ncbi:TlpA family protein disulfide reductase [Radiobacillus sp. PE A8.2]|uniref:TlpA family protein disulfide reductase n=1 Tax=Radiobacillus sp. PE A8.2 TaxID=3380349 RepID=UPI00388FB224
MIKKIVASVLLITLVAFVVYSLTERFGDNSGTDETELVSSQEGTAITAPNSNDVLDKGTRAPDFTLSTIDGESVSLSDYRGKVVFLNFWATWCGPCKMEMPEMEEFHQENDGNVEILAVNATQSEIQGVEEVSNFLQAANVTFTNVLDPEATVIKAFNVVGLPTTYIIDKDGVIQEIMKGPMTLEYMENTFNELN